MRRPIEILESHELQRFFATFSSSWTGLRNRAAFKLMLRSQLRASEVSHLRLHDLAASPPSITVVNGKGGKRRVVGIDDEALGAVQDWLNVRPRRLPPGTDPPNLFPTTHGRPVITAYWRAVAKRHAQRAGLAKRVHPHGFRHAGACQLLDEGFDIRIISMQLGHSSLAITHGYLAHLRPAAVLDAFRRRAAACT